MKLPPRCRAQSKRFLICVLAILSTSYLVKGLYFGIFVSGGRFPGAVDLHSRWIEAHYILRGENPYSITKEKVDLGLGSPTDTDYPPWTYISALPLLWPNWPYVRIWYAGVNVAGLLFITYFLLTRDWEKTPLEERILLALSVASIAAFCTTIGNGNFGVVVLALLFGAWIANDAGYQITAGLLLGLAMLKPNMAAPFLLVPLVQGRFRSLFAAATYLFAASIAVWILARANPLQMLLQMFNAAKKFTELDEGPLSVMLWLGLPFKYAVPLTGLSCVGVLWPLIWLRRNCDTLVLLGFAGVTSRLWTYHPNYSNMLLAFLLIGLGRFAKEERRFASTAFLAVGVSIWIPASLTNARIVQISEVAIWIFGLLCLFVLSRGRSTLFGETLPELGC